MAKSTLSPEERAAKSREYQRAYRAANAEKIHAYKLQNYAENKESILAANKLYRQQNKETVAAANLAWAKSNPDKIRAANLKWLLNNKDKHNELARDWFGKNPDKRKAAYDRWAENNLETIRYHTSKRRLKLEEQMPPWVVREELNAIFKDRPDDMHVDHIVPLRGLTFDRYPVSGLHVPWNLQFLTRSENSKKRNRMRLEDHATCGAPIE